MKKLISLLLIIAICFGIFSVSAVAASEDIVVSVAGGTAKKGSTITVPISLDVNKGFATLGIKVYYDADILEIVCPNHQDGQNCSPTIEKRRFNVNSGNSAYNSQYHTVNPYRIQWAYATITDNIYETGQIAAITFKVKDAARYGETKVTVEVDQASSFNNIARTVKGGDATIKVICTSHAYTNACDTICNTCGDVRKITHDYEWVIDEQNTCGKDGLKHEECAVCHVRRNENTVIPATGKHAYTNACDTICNTCGYVRTITHDYEWVIDEQNTCGKDGLKHEECAVCHVRRNENTVIPATGKHTYTNACDTICNICGDVRTTTHNFKWVIDVENSCIATGIKHEECTVCNVRRNENTVIPVSETHTYDNACDTTCNVCNEVRTITHSYKIYTTPATIDNDGESVEKCSVCGDVLSKRTIRRVKSVALSGYSCVYNGKRRTPAIVVKDYDGNTITSEHYRVSYATGRINVGRYKVVVALKGDYSGRSDFYFTILPPQTTVSKLTPGSKKITVDITKKTTQVTGYQIQYCTNTRFIGYSYKTIRSYNTVRQTLTGLKAKKTYYVRVRTYKTVGGKHYYSPWSAYKSTKTK